MAHEVESMVFYNEADQNNGVGRFVPWHGLGTPCDHAMSSAEALDLAGLNWKVISKPIYTKEGIEIPGYIANTRDSDGSVLGIVSNKYSIVQNDQAFAFTDALLDHEAKYTTAGSLKNGKLVWLLAELPKTKILGDEIAEYLMFANTHDGSGAVKVCMTPVRVVCNNTLNMALSSAKRTWTCKHMGSMENKLWEATHTLQLANQYMEELRINAEKLAEVRISQDEVHKIVSDMFSTPEGASERIVANAAKAKQEFMVAYYMPDIKQFLGTGWGLVNAASDFVSHAAPQRNTSTYAERNFEKVVFGHPIFDKIVETCMSRVNN